MEDITRARQVVVVTAHPDDEAFLAAGTIRRIADAGGRVTLVCATRGERGRAWTDLPSEVLGAVREQELYAASRLLGLQQVRVVGLPDGLLASYEDELARAVEQVVAALLPDLLLTFGVEGYTGHADHCATHRAVQAVACERAIPCAYFAHPPDPWRAEVGAALANKRVHGVYDAGQVPGGRAERVVVDPACKYTVLQAHQTQFPGLDPHRLFSAACAEHFLSHEYFVRPAPTPDA